MADAGQHRGALLDVRRDAVAHLEEGSRRLPHFAGAARAEVVGNLAALAERVGRLREPQNGPDLIAQEENGDGEQDHRRADHPQEEDVRVRGVGLRPRGDEAQNGVLQLDADFDVPRLADRVDPERPLHLAADLVRQRAVEEGEEGLGARRRQIARRQHLHRQVEPVARHLDELAVLVLAADTPRRCR